MKHKLTTRASHLPHSAGFTLVEMLVSVTLVLLMMTMFASIFSMATDSVSKQRGISENDQRARSLTTVIRSDFQHRTMRYPLAFYPGESSSTSPTPFGSRAGYLYISTNNRDSGMDDLIQFTISADIIIENTDDSPYYGAADLLNDRLVSGSTGSGISINPNQPEADDAVLIPNNTGNSPSAEVCYFVRKGGLYRRIMLIRKPLPIAGQDLRPQPTSAAGYDLFSGQPDPGNASSYDGKFEGLTSGLSNDFWRYFDYSAFARFNGSNQSTQFIGVDSLSNETVGAVADSFGNPANRFGFNRTTGVSREHSSIAVPLFIGRFVHAETSATNFNYPQNNSCVEGTNEAAISDVVGAPLGNGNPFDLVNTPLTVNVGNGLISEFDESLTGEGRGGVRRYEDLLLANVHEMRIELWDQRLQRFVTPAHNSFNASGEMGDYHVGRRLQSDFGPFGSASPANNHVYDSWHPQIDFDGDTRFNDGPPFIAYNFYPPRISDNPPGPSPDSMTGPVVTYWTPGQYNVGDIVFAPVGFDGDGGTEIFEWDQDVIPNQGFQIAYRCIATNDNGDGDGNIGETQPLAPLFPSVPGRTTTDNEVVWESFDNRRPLQTVRMTVRFMDQTTDTMRQLSLMMPLTDK